MGRPERPLRDELHRTGMPRPATKCDVPWKSKSHRMRLRRPAPLVSVIPRLRVWWNWQTRYFEVVVAKAVQVQVLPRAPKSRFF